MLVEGDVILDSRQNFDNLIWDKGSCELPGPKPRTQRSLAPLRRAFLDHDHPPSGRRKRDGLRVALRFLRLPAAVLDILGVANRPRQGGMRFPRQRCGDGSHRVLETCSNFTGNAVIAGRFMTRRCSQALIAWEKVG